MTVRPRDVLLALLCCSPLVAGLVLAGRTLFQPTPSFHEISELARAGRFDEAQARVSAYLRDRPESSAARLMMAELALNRPDPQPELALELLRHVKAERPADQAQVRLDEGKAYYFLNRYADAERAWLDALRLRPDIPEAGFALINKLYDVQGRRADARRLALKLHETEPDPQDRVRLLLELVRQDAQPIDPSSLVLRFQPVVERDPSDLHSTLALGLALIHASRPEPGLKYLRKAAADHPDDPHVWDAWLTGLADANRVDELAQALDRLPEPLRADPRFAKHRGRVAQEKHDWKAAETAYRRALDAEPDNFEVLYRLSQTLRTSGQTAEAELVEERVRKFKAAKEGIVALHDEAAANKELGVTPMPDLYRRLGDLRAQMGQHEEARAWYRLVLKDQPDDPETLAALRRLDQDAPTAGSLETSSSAGPRDHPSPSPSSGEKSDKPRESESTPSLPARVSP
jgi:tetratricopeptide (TPR) repeat protein